MEEEDEEEEEGGEGEGLGGAVDGYQPDEPGSNAAKRRARRKKLQHMFHVMKRGKFHEIADLQKEKYGGK